MNANSSLFPELETERDWTFHRAPTRDLTHCYHDYPARMIPQIARQLLEMFGRQDGLLFDPYCGTGTSLVEGRIWGMNVVGTDLNPLARLIAAAKTSVVSALEVEKYLLKLQKHLQQPMEEPPQEIAGIARLDFWFTPSVVKRLAHLRAFIESIKSLPTRRFFQVAWSETVRESSNTRNHEFKLYRMGDEDLDRFSPDVFGLMNTKLARNLRGLREFVAQLALLPTLPDVRIFEWNSVESVPDFALKNESIDLVLTSPPYGDSTTTVAYGQYSRLSSAWLGFSELESVDKKLMGGRALKSLETFVSEDLNDALLSIQAIDSKRAGEVAAFYADLESSIENIAPKIRCGGHACYVVGNRRVKGIALPTDDAVRRAFESSGFRWVDTFLRSIPNKRMPAKNSPSNKMGVLEATMTNEYIVVMEKIGD